MSGHSAASNFVKALDTCNVPSFMAKGAEVACDDQIAVAGGASKCGAIRRTENFEAERQREGVVQ